METTYNKNVDVEELDPTLELFGVPEGAEVSISAEEALKDGKVQEIDVSSVEGIRMVTFTFRENANTPGRILERSVAINRPPGAGFFTTMPSINFAYTSPDFRFLRERPLGQLIATLGLRGDNFVCTVRLTDSNQDDPIFITATGIVVFFR